MSVAVRKKKEDRPNRAMEFYRFLAAVMIMCYHCYWFAYREDGTQFIGYYLFVEMFFILSGFLMMRSIRRHVTPEMRQNPAGTTIRYITKRLKTFYPHHLLSFVLVLLMEIFFVKSMYPIEIVQVSWTELLLVNMFGFVRGKYINIVCWYLSSLIFGSLVIHYFVLKNEDGFIKIAAPILLVLLYGCLYDRIGCLATTILFTKYSPPLGFMRSFADITAGCVCYRIYEWMDDLELPGEELLATLVEIGVLLASFLYMYSNMSEVDFLFVPLFMAFVISVFRGKSLLSKMLDNPISEWLGRQTFAFFLNNAFIVYVCMFLFPGADVWSMCFFCVPACLIFSFITGTLIGTNKPRSRRI